MDIDTIKRRMKAAGSCWWDPPEMAFFNTVVASEVFDLPDGRYAFVTGEAPDEALPRRYTVRVWDETDPRAMHSVEFCAHAYVADALAAVKDLSASLADPSEQNS